MVEIWLPYGSSEIPVRVPEETLVDILRPEKASASLDVTEVRRLVQSSSSLIDLAKNSHEICIALGGSSHSQLAVEVTRSLVESLTEAGSPHHSITILCTPDAANLNLSTLSETKIIRHNPISSSTISANEFKGDFSPSLNVTLVNADLKIVVGELRPHHFLGYSGICDIVFPELASDISTQNQLSGRKNVDSSDLHKERLDIANSLKNLVALGFVLDGDLATAKISLGTIHECINDLKKTLQGLSYRKIEKTADIVIMSAGGAPMDESLARAVETFPAGLAALKRDGVLIVAAECALGHGDRDFHEWCAERKEPRHLEARLRYNFNYHGFKAAFLRRALEDHRIHLVSTIPDHYVENVFGMRPAQTVNSALQTVRRSMGSDSTISVIPDASRVVPQLI